MLIINGFKFYEEPGSCGTCPFLSTGNTNAAVPTPQSDRGHCLQWDETHHTWANVPRRCAKLFKKAFSAGYPDGKELVIVKKES